MHSKIGAPRTGRRHGIFTALTALDMSQTLKIAREPDRYHEHNPILGNHPSESDVLIYFGVTWAAQTALVHILPSDYRPWAQYVFIGMWLRRDN